MKRKKPSRLLLTSAFLLTILLFIGALMITSSLWTSEPDQNTSSEEQSFFSNDPLAEQPRTKENSSSQNTQKKEKIYVFLETQKEIVILDAQEGVIEERIPLPEEPIAAFLHAVDDKIYIAHSKTYAISIFDLRTKHVIKKIELRGRPSSLVMAKGLLYILLPDTSEVLAIDPITEGIEEEIPVNKESQQMIFSEELNRIFVTSKRPESLTIINPNIRAVADVLQLDHPPFDIAINPTKRYYYLTDNDNNQLIISPIKSVKQERTISTEIKPHTIVFTPNDRLALVSNEGSNTVSFVSTLQEKIIQTLSVGIAPTEMILTKDGTKAYIVNRRDRTISLLDVGDMKKTRDIVVGEHPVAILNVES